MVSRSAGLGADVVADRAFGSAPTALATFSDKESLICVISSCSNGVKDNTETDVDCGGPDCVKCAIEKGCAQNSDCKSELCDATSRVCVDLSCSDKKKGGDETGIDCGGSSCPACEGGEPCEVDTDCKSNTCAGSVCVSSESVILAGGACSATNGPASDLPAAPLLLLLLVALFAARRLRRGSPLMR